VSAPEILRGLAGTNPVGAGVVEVIAACDHAGMTTVTAGPVASDMAGLTGLGAR
jgi:agmatinase